MNAPHEPAVATAVQTLADVAAAYLAAYKGRDESRYQRIGAWVRLIGDKPFATLTPDDIDATMATLGRRAGARLWRPGCRREIPSSARRSGGRSGATLNRYMAQQGASLLEIADTLGHRQLRMVQRYAHLNTDSRRRLMTRVFEGRL
jgi:integrase